MALQTYRFRGPILSTAELQREVDPTATSVFMTGGGLTTVTIDDGDPGAFDQLMAVATRLGFELANELPELTVATAVSYVAKTSDRYVLITDTTAPRTITLPGAAPLGTLITVVDASLAGGNNPPTVQPAAGTVNGQASVQMFDDGAAMTFVSDGVDWHISAHWPGKSSAGQCLTTTGVVTRFDFPQLLGVVGALSQYRGGQVVQRRPTAVSVTCDTGGIVDYVVAVTSTAAPRVVTLPAATSGRVIVVVDESLAATSTNSISVVGPGGALINGLASFPIMAPGGAVMVECDGANWHVVAAWGGGGGGGAVGLRPARVRKVRPVAGVTATATGDDDAFRCTNVAGCTIDLPAANSVPNGWTVTAIASGNVGPVPVGFSPAGADTINGVNAPALSGFANAQVDAVSDGVSNWDFAQKIN